MSKSATARALEKAELYGARPPAQEDQRPIPHPDDYQAELAAMFHSLGAVFADTRLEHEGGDLQWGLVNLFHRKALWLDERLERNELEQQVQQRQQDGSEVKSVELERLIQRGIDLVEARDSLQAMRDYLAELFSAETGKPWVPHNSSRVSTHARATTAAMIDSRDFVAAQRRERNAVHIPEGIRIAFTGGIDVTDHAAITEALDKVHREHPDMVLLHGGCAKGAELIAAKWARARNVPQIAFKPEWKTGGRSAPFKRNDQIIAAEPTLVIAAPGSGVVENLVQKAVQQMIPVRRIPVG